MKDAMALPDFDTLWDYNDPAATELKFLALLPAAEAADDSEHRAYLAELLTQIARTHSLRRSFEIAHETLDRTAALLGPDDDLSSARPRVRYLLERGRAFNSAGDAARATTLFMQACELASRAKLDAFAVDAAHMVAIAEPTADRQIEWDQ